MIEKLESVHVTLIKEDQHQVSEVRVDVINTNNKNSSRRLCGDKWDKQDADVICGMLNFPGALAAIKRYKKRSSIKKWLVDIECHGKERNIAQCYQRENDKCESNYAAGIMCHDSSKKCKYRIMYRSLEWCC